VQRSPTSTLAAGLSTWMAFKMVAPSLVTVTSWPRPMLWEEGGAATAAAGQQGARGLAETRAAATPALSERGACRRAATHRRDLFGAVAQWNPPAGSCPCLWAPACSSPGQPPPRRRQMRPVWAKEAGGRHRLASTLLPTAEPLVCYNTSQARLLAKHHRAVETLSNQQELVRGGATASTTPSSPCAPSRRGPL
jgi:hypothetical protein